MTPSLETALLVGAVVLLTAIVAVRYANQIGIPSLLAYLAIGLALQALIRFDDAAVAQNIGLGALVLILAEGGLTTRWDDVRPCMPAALALATVGVVVSAGVTAVAAHFVLGGSWRLAWLVGAILAPTDAAAVFSLLRRIRLPHRLAAVLEAESGLNDAPAVILVSLLSTTAAGSSWLPLAGQVIYELVIGGAVGLLVARLGVSALRRLALPASGLYPLAVLALAVISYALATLAHASGFLAVYLAALILGNAPLPHRPATRGFAEGIAWLAQITLFVMLGLLVTPSALPREAAPAFGIGAALLLLARPASVFASVVPLRWFGRALQRLTLPQGPFARFLPAERRTQAERGIRRLATALRGDFLDARSLAFASWAGLRGAVPIVLATIPVTNGVEGSGRVFALVFGLVVIYTVVQGPTLPAVARALRVVSPAEPTGLDVEAAPLEEMDADLLQLRIPQDSRLHGVEIFELRLPRGSAVTLVVRDGRSFVPTAETQLRRGDSLLVVTTARARPEVERRLRAVHRRGKLAAWYGERGS